MRRVELEIKEKDQIENILKNTNTIRLGVIADGMPYIIPLVFGYSWNDENPHFYMHSGMSGRKKQGLYDGARVCFEIDIEGPLMPSRTNYANNFSREFCCIMGEGVLHYAVNADEKKDYFKYIMQKQTGRFDYDFQAGWLSLTEVFRLDVDVLSASQKGMDNGPKSETIAKDFNWEHESKTAKDAVFWD